MNPKPDKFVPALYGGIIMGLVSSIPFVSLINCFCCAGIMLGGFLAVMFWKNNFAPGTPPFTSGDCMGIGAIAGVIGAVIATVLSFIVLRLFGDVMGQFITETMQDMNVEMPEEFWQAIEQSMSSGATLVSVFVSFVTDIIIFPIFGLLGGLIGYSVFKPKTLIPPAAPTVS